MPNTPQLRVIMMGASSDEAGRIVATLERTGYLVKPRCVYNSRAFEEMLQQQKFDLALWCEVGNGFSLGRAMQVVAQAKKNIPVIELRDHVSEKDRVESLRVGAADVVLIHNTDHLALVVGREMEKLSHYRKRVELERRYAESQKTCLELLESSKNALAFVSRGRHSHANPSYRRLFGYSYATEMKGLAVKELVVDSDARRIDEFMLGLALNGGRGEIDLVALGAGGSQFKANFKFAPANFSGHDAYRVIAKDLTRRRTREVAVNRLDALTGLVNHQYFLELLETTVSSIREEGGNGVLMLIELEYFRSIQAAVGIAGSDRVIRDLANFAHSLTNSAHTLARFADHTFTLYVPESTVKDSKNLADRLQMGIENHLSDVAGQSVGVSCSIGVVAISRSTSDGQTAMTHADMACRAAIHAGGSAVRVYEPATYETIEDHQLIVSASEILDAITDERINVRFQPIVSLRGDNVEVLQVEAQMHDEFDNLIGHEALLKAAAASQFEGQLDRWIVEQTLLCWGPSGGRSRGSHLLVRLSDESVKEPSLVLHLSRLLSKMGINGHRLIFEISDDIATSYVRHAKIFVEAVKRLGCQAALSRFGADSKSFRTLKHLDVDFLKIDESVINDLVDNPASQRAIRTIQETAAVNGKVTIATRVQNANGLALLWEMGVNYVQGDYIQDPGIELSTSTPAELVLRTENLG